jgi:prolyl-tRNA editing enzyme YbaK/EbsC (Cys-tRNA(Pro) deacylase)
MLIVFFKRFESVLPPVNGATRGVFAMRVAHRPGLLATPAARIIRVAMAKSIDRVREYFRAHNLPIQIQELPGSTRTAQLAAEAVGSQLGQIVKSLVFIDAEDRTVLALVAGDRRAVPEKIARTVNSASVRIANAEEVRARTGFAIGGVAPIAHPEGSITERLLDDSLQRFEIVWAAAGAPNAVFPIELETLLKLTQARVADIAVSAA